MLGVCLLFVGIVLINNGMCSLYNVDGKSTAIMNIFTGGLSLFINFVNLVQGNYYAAGTGLLFCFTYIFVALSKFLKASPIPFAWFSTFVAINAVIFGTIEGFTGSTALGITIPSFLSIFRNHILHFCFFRSLILVIHDCLERHIPRLDIFQQRQQVTPAQLCAADGPNDLIILFLFLCSPDISQVLFQFRDLAFGFLCIIQKLLQLFAHLASLLSST